MKKDNDGMVEYKPLLKDQNITPARAEQLADQIMRKALDKTNEAVQRGKFELHDLEAITAACLATAMQAGERDKVRSKVASIMNVLQKLTGIVKAREEIEIQKEMSDKVSSIEGQVEKIKHVAEKNQ